MNLITESIGEVAEQIRTGKTPPTKISEYFGGAYNWFTPGDFSENLILESSARFISDKAVAEGKATIFEKDTVLISCIGDIGKVGVLKRKSSCNQQITGVTLKPHINPVFFAYWCKANKYIFENKARNAVVPILNNAVLSTILVTFPEQIDDQNRIAHLLGKVEGLIAQRKQHLQQLDDLIKSVFLEMFDGVNKGVELTIGAAIKQGFILLHKDGNHGSNYPRKEEFGDLGVPFITAKSIDEFGHLIPSSIEHLNEEKANKLTIGWIEGGDVLLAHNATVGRVGLYRGEFGRALIGTSLTAFRPNVDLLKPIYLHELFRSHFFQRQLFWGMGQATRNQVPITAQRELLIRVPEPSLQNRFAVIFEKVEGLKSRYQKSLTDLEDLYGALSQQAFKGALDLSRVPLPNMQSEEEIAVVTDPLQPQLGQGQAIHLPDTDNLLDAIESPEGRQKLMSHWLEAYLSQLGIASFSVQDFMAAAQTRLAELHPDNDFELGLSDYEYIKSWTFEALESGHLRQERNQVYCEIETKKTVLGNSIELKSGDQI